MNRESVVNAALNILNLEIKQDEDEKILCDRSNDKNLGVINDPLWSKITDNGTFSIKMISDEKSHLKYCVSLVNNIQAINMFISRDKSKEFEVAIYKKIEDLFGRLFVSDKKISGQITSYDNQLYNFSVLVNEEVSNGEVKTVVEGTSFDKKFKLSTEREAKDNLTQNVMKMVNLMDLFAENKAVFNEFNKMLDEFERNIPGIKNFVLNYYNLGKMMYNEANSKVLKLN